MSRTLSFTDLMVVSGATYHYEVTAVGAHGEGRSSQEANATIEVSSSSTSFTSQLLGSEIFEISMLLAGITILFFVAYIFVRNRIITVKRGQNRI